MTSSMQVFVVDDDLVIIEALKSHLQLSRYSDIEIVMTASTKQEAFALLAQPQCYDIVLADLFLISESDPKRSFKFGLEVIEKALSLVDPPKVLAFSGYIDDPEYILLVHRAGAKGFVDKNKGMDPLIEAMRRIVYHGGQVWPLEYVDYVVRGDKIPSFTELERNVLDLMTSDKRDNEIAEILGFSSDYIRRINQGIFQKMEVRTRTGAAVKWDRIRQGRSN